MYCGRNWCQGIPAVPKKSHPHPKGSEADCRIKVLFTKSMGMTKAIQFMSPSGRRAPAETRNASFVLAAPPDNLEVNEESMYKMPGIITSIRDHKERA